MKTYILNERVLTDDELLIPNKGKIFKGGYIAIIQEYTYENEWSDKPLKPLKFRSKERLLKHLDIHYPEFEALFEGTCIE